MRDLRGWRALPLLIDRLARAPAALLGRSDLGSLRPGTSADVVVFDPDAEWVVDPAQFASKGKNTPLAGVTLKGRVAWTIYGGKVVHSHQPSGVSAPRTK